MASITLRPTASVTFNQGSASGPHSPAGAESPHTNAPAISPSALALSSADSRHVSSTQTPPSLTCTSSSSPRTAPSTPASNAAPSRTSPMRKSAPCRYACTTCASTLRRPICALASVSSPSSAAWAWFPAGVASHAAMQQLPAIANAQARSTTRFSIEDQFMFDASQTAGVGCDPHSILPSKGGVHVIPAELPAHVTET